MSRLSNFVRRGAQSLRNTMNRFENRNDQFVNAWRELDNRIERYIEDRPVLNAIASFIDRHKGCIFGTIMGGVIGTLITPGLGTFIGIFVGFWGGDIILDGAPIVKSYFHLGPSDVSADGVEPGSEEPSSTSTQNIMSELNNGNGASVASAHDAGVGVGVAVTDGGDKDTPSTLTVDIYNEEEEEHEAETTSISSLSS